jgi:uroporphyrinogen decarboxylase
LNSRERFAASLRFQQPDRIPFYDEEIREETLARWYEQGLPKGRDPRELFRLEKWDIVPVNLEMIPEFQGRFRSRKDFERLKKSFNPDDTSRYPTNWENLVGRWKDRDHPLGISVWEGLFQPFNSGNVTDTVYHSLTDIVRMIYSNPELLVETVNFIAEFVIRTMSNTLDEVKIDYAIIWEPIAENKGPAISPPSFQDLVIPCYKRIIETLNSHGIDIIILSTFGNVKELIPLCLDVGINVLWCRGTKPAGVDYVALRKKYGQKLALIGGIDIECLTEDKEAIKAEIYSKVPPLLSSGGYIPMLDGRVRENIPFKNYAYYRRLIEEIACKKME